MKIENRGRVSGLRVDETYKKWRLKLDRGTRPSLLNALNVRPEGLSVDTGEPLKFLIREGT